MSSGVGWLWLVGAAALIGFVGGLLLFALGRSGSAARTGRTARFGAVLALASLVAIVALGGLTLAGAWPRPDPASVDPGLPGFVAGTVAAPRLVRIIAGPDLRFYPDVVPIVAGETITFEVTTMGVTAHEFMVGPAADVATDTEGTPEVADVGMMQTKTLTYTFEGPGPFSFACHAPGHYEDGMRGTIDIQP